MPIDLTYNLHIPPSDKALRSRHEAIIGGQLDAQRKDRTKFFDDDQAMLDKTATRANDRRREIWQSNERLYNRIVASDQMFDAAAHALSHKQLMQVLKDSAEIKGGTMQARILAGYHQSMEEYNQDWELAESQLRAGSMIGMATLRNVLTGVAGDAKSSANLQSLKKFRQSFAGAQAVPTPTSQPTATPTEPSSVGASPQAMAYAASKPKPAVLSPADADAARKKVMWGDQATPQPSGPSSYGGPGGRPGYDEAACYASQCLARVVNSNFGKEIISTIDDPEHPGEKLQVPLEVMMQGMNGSSTLTFPNGRVITDAKGVSDKAFRALPGLTQGFIRGGVKRALVAASIGQPGFDEKALGAVLGSGKPEDIKTDQEQLAIWKAATQGVTVDPDIQAVFLNAAENVYQYTGGVVQPHDIAKVRTAATRALAEAAGIKETEIWDKTVLIKDMMMKDRIGAIQAQVRAGNDPALTLKDFVSDTPLGRMTKAEAEKAKPYILQAIASDPLTDDSEKSARIGAFNEAWSAATGELPSGSEPGSPEYQRAFRESPTGQSILQDPEKAMVPGQSEPTLKVPYPFTMPEDLQPGDITNRYYQITAKTAMGSSYGAALDPNVIKTYTDTVSKGKEPLEALPPNLKPDESGQDELLKMAGAQSQAKEYPKFEQSPQFKLLEATEPTNIGEGSNALNQERKRAAMEDYNKQKKEYTASAGMDLGGSLRPAMDPNAQPLQHVTTGQPQATPGAAPTGRGSAPAPAAAPATAPAPGPAAPPADNNPMTPSNPWSQVPAGPQYGFGNSLLG